MEAVLSKGCRVIVSDIRKKKDPRIAEGDVYEIREQNGIKFVYLNSGYFLVIYPPIREEKREEHETREV